jgi:hypothetical protein
MDYVSKIIKANKKYCIENELSECIDEERVLQLKMLMKIIDEHKDEKEIVSAQRNAHFEMLKNSQYNKKWHTLNKIQQLNRFEEYAKRNNITDIIYIDKVKQAINEKQIKAAYIVYDTTNGKILNFNGPYVS